MFKRRLLAALLVVGLALTGCNGGNQKPADNQKQTETDKQDNKADNKGEQDVAKDKEQYFNTWDQEEPPTLNSAKSSARATHSVLLNVMEPLVRSVEQKDHTLKLEPAAAEKWDISEDGKTYTFHLRDMKWSDGQPVKAQDYLFGIKTSVDPKTGAGGSGYLVDCIKGAKEILGGKGNIDSLGVKAPDDKTLVVELDSPTSYFLELCATLPMMPIRQDVYEQFGERYGAEADTIVTNGPFKLTSWVHNSALELQKSDSYWDKDKVSYEKISWRIMQDLNTRFNAFKNGELDTMGANVKEWREQFDKMENVTHEEIPSPAVDYLFFNTKAKPFDNPKVRLAFSLAINREEAIHAIYNDVGKPAYGWVTYGIQSGDKDYREAVPGPLEALKQKYADPKALLVEGLKEAGVSEDPSQLTVKLEFGGTSQKMKEIGEYFINAFKSKLGVNVEVAMNEWAAFTAKVNQGQVNVGYMAWFADYNDPYSMLSLLMKDVNGVYSGWANDKYDELVTKGKTAKDANEAREYYKQAEEILMEESPVIPLLNSVSNVYRYKYVKNAANNAFATQGLKYGYTAGRK